MRLKFSGAEENVPPAIFVAGVPPLQTRTSPAVKTAGGTRSNHTVEIFKWHWPGEAASRWFVLLLIIAVGQASAFQSASHPAAAQDPEGPWRTEVLEALHAAGAKDYPKAEQAFQKAVQEASRFGADDPRLGTTLNGLGLVYRAEKKYGEAESAYRKALSIMEDAYGSSIDTANLNFNIANVMFDQGHQAEALPNLQRTATIYERLLGEDSMKTADVLCMEGDAYRLTKRYAESETALRKCADAREMNGGLITNGPLADALHSLAQTLVLEGKFSAAEPRLKIAEQIRERTLGITSPVLAQTMEDRVSVLKELGRYKDAERLTAMAAAIRKQSGKSK